jgi:hypothetical protein
MDADPHDVWDGMAGEVAYALAYDWHSSLEYFDSDTVLVRYDARDDDPGRVDVRKRFVRVFDSERAFVRRVWGMVAELREAGRRVVVLFDIDQTLGSRKGRDGQSATLVRPAAPLLMARLHEAGVVMGILTTRGISELHRNLEDVLHLQGVAPYLDPAHLTAAEMERYHSETPTVSADRVSPEVFARFCALLRAPYDDLETFRASQDERGSPLPVKDVDKLLQLAVVRSDHPEATFVVVDDRDYAGLLAGPAQRVVGVHLAEHERAHF